MRAAKVRAAQTRKLLTLRAPIATLGPPLPILMNSNPSTSRRQFLAASTAALAASALAPRAYSEEKKPAFKISLAEWSFHKALFAKKLTHLDFPRIAKKEFGITACEHV